MAATRTAGWIAATSARLFIQRATPILGADIFALPYPKDEDLDLSENERIIAEDIVEYQRDFIRLGTKAPVMQTASADTLTAFDQVFTRQLSSIYSHNPLRPLGCQEWSGAICRAYVFGEGEVDWSGADELRNRLNALLLDRRGSGLTVTRITRLYDKGFVFLLKPDRHRFWTRSIALRDADDVLADLREQGF